MPLAADILALKARTVGELNAAHDYYIHTSAAWQIVQEFAAGQPFTLRNHVTKSAVSHTDLVRLSKGYVARQLREATFVQFVSLFETFFFDLLRLWLVAHPRTLLGKQVDFQTVLDAAEVSDIVRHVADRELNELTYKKPADWFRYLDGRVKVGCPTAAEIDRFAEAKASRDVLVHNRGTTNRTYLTKAGPLARYADGEPMDVPEPYHRATWELFGKVVEDIADAAAAKA
jgi:hypothetical protein